jgi:hypothetical protein
MTRSPPGVRSAAKICCEDFAPKIDDAFGRRVWRRQVVRRVEQHRAFAFASRTSLMLRRDARDVERQPPHQR